MVLGICGYTYTGSGAYIDLLKEYREVELLTEDDFEFSYVYRTDGIIDLQFHLQECVRKDIDGDLAVYRFLRQVHSESGSKSRIQRLTRGRYATMSEEYINALTSVKWLFRRVREFRTGSYVKALNGRIRYRIQRFLNKKCNHYVSAFPEVEFRLCSYPEDFQEKSRAYIMGLLEAMRKTDSPILAVDQPFLPTNPTSCFPFFDDPMAIVVDRDPRDLFLMYKKVCFARGHLTDDVENFIKYYQQTRKNISHDPSDRILRLNFEDLIYKYEDTIGRIERFLGIREHAFPKKFFNPEVSINNTQLILKYPEEKDNICRIEECLTEYLYPFDKMKVGNQSVGAF